MKKNVILIIVGLCLAFFGKAEAADISGIDNVVYAEDMSCAAGSSFTMSVKMKNIVGITGFQFDLELPSGITVGTDDEGFSIVELSTERTTAKRTDYFNSAYQTDGSLRVMASSTTNLTFDGNDGEVATILINVADDVADGEYSVIMKNIVLSDAAAHSYETERVEAVLTVESASYDQGYTVYTTPLPTTAGAAKTIVLNFAGIDENITDIEFDMEMPSCLSRTKSGRVTKAFESADEERMFVDGTEGDHTITVSGSHVTIAAIVDDEYKFIAGTEGPLVNMYYTTAAGTADGIYPITLSNITLTNGDGGTLHLAPTTSYIKVGNPTGASLALAGHIAKEVNEAIAGETALATVDMGEVVSMDGTLSLIDGRNFVAPRNAVDAEKVVYNRSLNSEYGTICMPFALTSDAAVQYYKLTAVNESTMSFEPVVSIEAGEPALFKSLSGNALSIEASNATVEAGAKEKAQDAAGWTIVGTYEASQVGEADYIIANNKFWNAGQLSNANDGAEVWVAPFRAYLHNTEVGPKATSLKITIEDEAAAIEVLSADSAEDAEYFDISGRKVRDIQRGVNNVKWSEGKAQIIIIK